MSLSLAQIAKLVNGKVIGDASRAVDCVAALSSADNTAVTFIAHKKYLPDLRQTRAGVVLLSDAFLDDCPVSAVLVKDPYLAYSKIASALYPRAHPGSNVHPTAVIEEGVKLGEGVCISANAVIGRGACIGDRVYIGPNCVIGDGTIVGCDCYLYPNVTVYHDCILGADVCVQSGAVIGSDGFGYAPDGKSWSKIPQVGRVIIGNRVEIGANTTVDRGAIEDTIIADGVIIDNLVQVAHNVRIGKNTAMAACSGIAGSTEVGENCTLAGGVGVNGHIHITDQVHVTAMSMVTNSIRQSGAYSSGTPLQSNAAWQRNAVRIKQLDQLAKRIKKIENKVFSDNT